MARSLVQCKNCLASSHFSFLLLKAQMWKMGQGGILKNELCDDGGFALMATPNEQYSFWLRYHHH